MELDIQSLISGAASLAVIVGIFIEITPVKINPVSTLLKFIGSNINAELKEEIASVKAEVESTNSTIQKVDNKVDDNEIDRIRWEILDFSNSCRSKKRHTKEEFDHIISLNQKYHRILDEREEENGQVELAFEYIRKIYCKCLENNSFLCANGDDDC